MPKEHQTQNSMDNQGAFIFRLLFTTNAFLCYQHKQTQLTQHTMSFISVLRWCPSADTHTHTCTHILSWNAVHLENESSEQAQGTQNMSTSSRKSINKSGHNLLHVCKKEASEGGTIFGRNKKLVASPAVLI